MKAYGGMEEYLHCFLFPLSLGFTPRPPGETIPGRFGLQVVWVLEPLWTLQKI
jgi:hypothetical protein